MLTQEIITAVAADFDRVTPPSEEIRLRFRDVGNKAVDNERFRQASFAPFSNPVFGAAHFFGMGYEAALRTFGLITVPNAGEPIVRTN